MKLVGLGLTMHDSSIAAYNNGKFLYRKAERQFQSKHAFGGLRWAQNVLKEWDMQDSIIAQSSWLKGKDPNIVVSKNNIIDHHFAHSLSCTKKHNKHYVVDALSTGPANNNEEKAAYTGMVIDGCIQRISDLSIPAVLRPAVWSKYFEHETELRTFYADVQKQKIKLVEWAKILLETQTTDEKWKHFVKTIDLPGKIMGLQAYGKPDMECVDYWLKQQYPRLSAFYETNSEHVDTNTISTLHKFCEKSLIQRAPEGEFGYSGGVAQNVVFNRALIDAGYKPDVYPWSYDGGCSIGALNFLLDKHDIERTNHWEQDDQSPHERPRRSLIKRVAELIAQNKVVGWYQGHGEVGPRALGNRSILFNPTHKDGKATINKIKQREWWRPFGASVKEDHAHMFFDLPVSRHMLYNSNVQYSGIPAVTHVDGTCRHQTVPQENELYYELLDEVEKLIDVPIVGNTSLNIKGKPIVATIEDAKKIKLDAICIGNELYENLHS